MSAYREAAVYVLDRLAGFLSEMDSGYRFVYHADYLDLPDAAPVSLTLPFSFSGDCSRV